ncbi:sporulation initiation inhibitor protein soj [Candidatus Magnetoovum chiemensis]|nr:sporulation initiation inhibitor protein soj [Candidatus Magnetoovum chiemensis]
MGKIISLANQKGGVGKTTTAINLASSIALAGKDILIIDTDPQCNSTSGLGIVKSEIKKTLYDLYQSKCEASEIILSTPYENLYIIPSSLDLLAVEIEIVNNPKREWILSEAIKNVRERFEFTFLDCPPSLGLLTLNSLVASDGVLIPVQCEYYALEGLSMLTRTINMVKRTFNNSLEIEGILLTMFDKRNSLSLQVAKEVKKFFGDKVYKTIIPRNVTLGEAPGHGKPVLDYDIKSRGAQSYLSLAREILDEKSSRQRP